MKSVFIRDKLFVPAIVLQRNFAGFGKPFLKALPWIFAIVISVMLLENAGAFTGFESIVLDTFVRIKSSKPSGDVAIVEITDEDYRQYFGSTSPLQPAQLASLISSAAQGKPRVIGVDVDTSTQAWCDPAIRLPTAPRDPPIVWAEVPGGELKADGSDALRRVTSGIWTIVTGEREATPKFTAAPVVGGRLCDAQCVGIPLFPLDRDGVVRRERNEFEVTPLPASCPKAVIKCTPGGSQGDRDQMLSLAHAIVAQVRPGHREPPAEQILNFARDRYNFRTIPAHEILSYSQQADGSWPIAKPAWLTQGLLKDSVLLIGGTYRAAREEYLTPVGPTFGVFLVAQTVEAHLHPGGVQEARWFWKKLVDFLSAILIVWLYFHFGKNPRRAFRTSVVGTLFISIVGSFLLFDTMAYWFDFVPVVIGMLLHQMYEQSKMAAEIEESQAGKEHAA